MDHFNWAKEAMESAGAANTVEYVGDLVDHDPPWIAGTNDLCTSLTSFFEARLLRTIGKSLIGKGWQTCMFGSFHLVGVLALKPLMHDKRPRTLETNTGLE